MGSHSYPKHLKGRRALPATDEATEVEPEEVEINISTAAANNAAALGIDLNDLKGLVGSGKDGLITVADVKNWSTEPEEG
jgi:pyruvate/2-oxoglutarate dehydrogenase complex dihydrolipoamide acyltransferase (E2) component